MLRLTLIFAFLQFHVEAQKLSYTTNNNPDIHFEQPDALQKAGVKSIRCIYKDSRQFMWLGTENGLFRFDGTHVIYAKHFMDDKTSLPNNDINNIAEDKKGNLWIGTNGGIAKMNVFNFHCEVFRAEDQNLDYNSDNKVFIDDSSTIWAINPKGLSRFNVPAKKFESVWSDVLNNQPQSSFALCIASYNEKKLVIGTFNDLVLIDKKDFSFKRLPLDAAHPKTPHTVTNVLADAKGNLWVGTWAMGLLFFDENQQRFTDYKWQYPASNFNNIINSMTITHSQGNEILWIASGVQLLKVPLLTNKMPDANRVILYPFGKLEQTDAAAADKIPILEDETGSIWLGGKTVKRFLPENNAVQTLNAALQGEKQDMQLVSIDGKPFYFICAFHGKNGFYILDSGMHIIKQSRDYPLLRSVDAQNISGIAVDSTGRIWISTLAGIYLMDKHFMIIHKIDNASKKDTLSKLKTNAVFISHDSVWIACYKKGIDLFNTNFHKLRHFENNDGSGLKDDIIWKFFKDRKGTMWVCGNSMLYRFMPQQGSFRSYALTPEGNGCVPREMAERSDGTFLIASENGLIQFDPVTEKYHYLNSPLLQKEENILSVCIDENGNAWYLTESHLVNYDFSRNSFTLYGRQDGINTNEPFYLIRNFGNNRFLIVQGRTIIAFKKQDLHPVIKAPVVMITQTQINDSTLLLDSPITKLDLAYFQNKILFEFTGITYIKPEQNQYAFQLSGIDKDWIYTNRNISVYANLSPGDYMFRAKVSNYAGIWSNPYSIAIHIHSPFWKTWWFIFLSVLLALGILYSIYRYRLHQLFALERLRSKISTDLHDDIGSTLSSISILSDMLSREKKEEESVEMATEIKNNSISLMEKMDDIVWSINPKNDTLENLLIRIKRFAAVLFEAKDIDYNISIYNDVSSIRLPMEYRQHIYLIMKEAINNLVKYSNATHADIIVSYSNSHLKLQVKDNGKGFDSLQQIKGNGIINMKNRAELMRAELGIDSKIDQGTIVSMSVKIK